MNEYVDIDMMQIETTKRCNLNCPHCALYEKDEKGTDYTECITTEVIDKFFEKNVRSVKNLNFTGGEPLLNVDAIVYTLEKIMREKIVVIGIDIATNGTILSEKLIDTLNIYTNYVMEEVWGSKSFAIRDIKTSKEKNKYDLNEIAQIRISRLYHENDKYFEKALDFYGNKANELVKVFAIDDNIGQELKRIVIAYSGRAKKLNTGFYCDSPRHKIVYEEYSKENEVKCVKCPLKLMTNGDVGISSYCSIKDAHQNAIGNVNCNKSLYQMITEWNYEVPINCDEACKLAEAKMYYETKRLEDISRVLNKNISFEDLEKMTTKVEAKIFFMETYRKLLHEKLPQLTPDEIEWISQFAFDLECQKANNELSEDEISKISEEIDNHIGKLVFEHLFDDVKEIHEEFPYLTHNECLELRAYRKICEGNEKNKILIYPFVLKAKKLIDMNEYRAKNVKSIFE